jgi:hypothetical protein
MDCVYQATVLQINVCYIHEMCSLAACSGATVGLLAALVYEKFALPLPYSLEYEV